MTHSNTARARWMSVLARAPADEVIACKTAWTPTPAYTLLRGPEPGLVMTQARMGGTGDAFNLGEMTVTRCSLRLEDGTIGQAYVAGRSKDHALAAALFDAIMQGPCAKRVEDRVIGPLEAMLVARRNREARQAAATRVSFVTMPRDAAPR
ncbi:MAG: phosphonate C-P lyase system protein PhnG [Alphaproteobacteria bacterium]